MGRNHCILFNELVILVLGRYGVLRARMNSTEVLVKDRDRTASGERRSGCDEAGEAVVVRVGQFMVEDSGREGWGKGRNW